MLKKYFIMAFAAGFTLVACSEKIDESGILPAGSDNVHTLSVGIEAGIYTPAEGETKASMEAVIRVNWTEGDKVSVVNATTGKILGGCLEAKASGTSVTFEGTVTGEINNGNRLYYIYPRLDDNTEEKGFENAGYDQKLAGQKYDATKPNEVCFFGYAEDVAGTVTISKKIQFNLVTAYAHLNMSNLPAKGASMTSIDISNVNEGFTWKLSSEKTLSAEPYVGNNGISVTCTNNNITQAGNAVVRFALPASAASQQGRVITVNKAYKNDKYTVKEFEKASYHNQLYTSWESNVSVTSQTGKTEVAITNEGSTEVAEGVLPVSGESSSAFDGNKQTEISLGGLGTITFNEQASNAIKTNTQNAQSTNVFFKVEDVTQTKQVDNANIVYEITMKTMDGKGTEVFSKSNAGAGSSATIAIPIGQGIQGTPTVSLIDEEGNTVDDGTVSNVSYDSNTGLLTFEVSHFSKYAIKYNVEDESEFVARIGKREYKTITDAFAVVKSGQTVEIHKAGTYTLPSPISNLTIKGIEGVVFNAMKEYGQSVSLLHDVNFESVKFIFGSNNYTGFQHSESVSFTKCIFDGKFNSYGTMLFEQCTFNSPEGDYSMWCYAGNVTYKNCTINCKGKFANVYNEGNALTDGDGNRVPWKVVAEGCTFNSSVKNKAALNIKATCGAKPLYYDVEIKNCIANGENWPAASTSESLVVGSALWQVDDINASVASKIKVTVDDTVVYTSPVSHAFSSSAFF